MSDRTHLSDLEIQELLDGALDSTSARRVHTHLETCGSCARRLDSASRLLAAIGAWEDTPPQRDLAPDIVRSLRQATPFGLRVATAVQAGLVVLLAALAWPFLAGLGSWVTVPRVPALEIGLSQALTAQAQVLLASAQAVGLQLQTSTDAFFRLAPQWVTLWPAIVAGAALAAVVGNSILLSGPAGNPLRSRPRRL